MGLTALGIVYASRGVGIVVAVVCAGSRAGILGVSVDGRRVCGVVVVGVALDLIGHDGRYTCVTIMSCVTARLNEGIRRHARVPRTTIHEGNAIQRPGRVVEGLIFGVVAALALAEGGYDDVEVRLQSVTVTTLDVPQWAATTNLPA